MLKVEVTKMSDVKGYDWKKTAVKLGKSALIVFLTGIVVVFTEDPRYLCLVPLAEATLNYLKHKNK